MFVILVPIESRPAGKMIRESGVFVCFHFMEEGSPLKTWENPGEEINSNKKNNEIF